HCSYLHIAGHGSTTADDSLQVGFQLSDGIFTLRHLAGCNTDSGTLAVLLTCDSAAGDTQTPNEALHVAGAAHQAGFPDVIAATMPVRDASTLPVVRALYQALDAAPNAASDIVPAALDVAAQTLRLGPATATDPLSWVPYAHFRAGLSF
ncbi:MAG TPA: CHAT domain-containing protein, partial [Polyangiaceae bacterium]|nr:CHAT domain-containing protein [Polyangiaceae bacterium]